MLYVEDSVAEEEDGTYGDGDHSVSEYAYDPDGEDSEVGVGGESVSLANTS